MSGQAAPPSSSFQAPPSLQLLPNPPQLSPGPPIPPALPGWVWGPSLSYLMTLCRIFLSSWSRHTAKGQLLEPMICTLSTLICEVLIWKQGQVSPGALAPEPGQILAASSLRTTQLGPGRGAGVGLPALRARRRPGASSLTFPGSGRSQCLGRRNHIGTAPGSLTRSPLDLGLGAPLRPPRTLPTGLRGLLLPEPQQCAPLPHPPLPPLPLARPSTAA